MGTHGLGAVLTASQSFPKRERMVISLGLKRISILYVGMLAPRCQVKAPTAITGLHTEGGPEPSSSSHCSEADETVQTVPPTDRSMICSCSP